MSIKFELYLINYLYMDSFLLYFFLLFNIFTYLSASKTNTYYELNLNSDVKWISIDYDWSKIEPIGQFIVITCCLHEFDKTEDNKNDIFMYSNPSIIKTISEDKKQLIPSKSNVKCYFDSNKYVGRYLLNVAINFINNPPNSKLSELFKISVENNDGTKLTILPISNHSFSVQDNKRIYKQRDIDSDYKEVESRYGYKLVVETYDKTISHAISTYGIWQHNIARVLLNLVQEGDKIIHLGGHLGTFDLLMSDLVGENGRVVVYEPVPKTFKLLEKNINLNYRNNISAVNKGGYSESIKKYFNVHFDNTGATKAYDEYKENLVEVSLVKLEEEEILKELGHPNLIMMDIEGAEFHAYSGMKNLISNINKPIMIWEWGINLIKEQNLSKNGDYEALLNELDSDHEFFIVDLFVDVYVKVSKEFLITQTAYENFDIIIVPTNHKLNSYINSVSVIIDPPSPITNFTALSTELFIVKVDFLDKDMFKLLALDTFQVKQKGARLLIIQNNNNICGKITSTTQFCNKMDKAIIFDLKEYKDYNGDL